MNEIKIKKPKNKDLIFFSEAIEYFDKYNTQDLLNSQASNRLNVNNNNLNFLRDQMLIELRNLKNLIINSFDSKLKALSEEERNVFCDFIKAYSVCPICGNFNDYLTLKKLFFDEKNRIFKEELIKVMKLKNRKLHKFKLNFGIPCCSCFKRHFKNKF